MSTFQLPCQRRLCSGLGGSLNVEDLAIGAHNSLGRAAQIGVSSKAIDDAVGEIRFGDWRVIVLGHAQGIQFYRA